MLHTLICCSHLLMSHVHEQLYTVGSLDRYTRFPYVILSHNIMIFTTRKLAHWQTGTRYGQEIAFYTEVPQILCRLRAEKNVTIAACSRTSAPALYFPNSCSCCDLTGLICLNPGRGKLWRFYSSHLKQGAMIILNLSKPLISLII